jgi:D-galactarolactone cycloisomerase
MATFPPVTGALNPPPVLFEFDQTENPFREAVIKERITIEKDGLIPVPSRPGLGVTVEPDAVEQFRAGLITIA